ncbi:unnamed protein product [Musa acuminata var. zebrina]
MIEESKKNKLKSQDDKAKSQQLIKINWENSFILLICILWLNIFITPITVHQSKQRTLAELFLHCSIEREREMNQAAS